MNRPDCRFCRNPLTQYWTSSRAGRTAIKTKTKSYGPAGTFTTYWYGEYGHHGNNFFCTMTCGYMWALRKVMDGHN